MLHEVIDDYSGHVVAVRKVCGRLKATQREERVHSEGVTSNGIGSEDVLVVVVYSGHDIFDVDRYDALVAIFGSAWVGDANDSAPLDIVRLPSSFCLNVLTSSGHGHLSVKTMSHMREIKSGDGWKKRQ